MRLDIALREYRWFKQYSPASLKTSRFRLGPFADWLAGQGVTEVEAITAGHVREYQRQLSARPLAAETLLGMAKQLHAFLVWCEEEEMVTGLSKRVVMPRKESKALRTLTPREVAALMDAAGRGQCRERDRAILAVLADTGIRASELCGLRLEDIHVGDDGAWLLVRGKGKKERIVALGSLSRRLLVRYTQRYRPRQGDATRAFLTRSGREIATNTLHALLLRLAESAGVGGVSAHAFRRTYAVEFLKQGGDVARLARSMGHSSLTTTILYLTSYSSADVARASGGVLDGMGHEPRR
jgi:site-specific recombinase XerD